MNNSSELAVAFGWTEIAIRPYHCGSDAPVYAVAINVHLLTRNQALLQTCENDAYSLFGYVRQRHSLRDRWQHRPKNEHYGNSGAHSGRSEKRHALRNQI